MTKPILVILVTARQFKALAALINHVIANMATNPGFIAPSPSLAVVQTAQTGLESAIAAWGPKGNRGSHDDYITLKSRASLAHTLIRQLSSYCMTVVDPNSSVEEQTALLNSTGFPLKHAATPQGALQPVQNFRRFFSPELNADQVKLKWKKPLNVVVRTNVKNYNVYRNNVNNFSTSSIIASVTHATYTDTAAPGIWYYWIVATNTVGNGAVSNVILFTSTSVV